MAGGKGKSTGGKAGPKETTPHKQKSHSAKAGLQVSITVISLLNSHLCQRRARPRRHDSSLGRLVALCPRDTISQTARTAIDPRDRLSRTRHTPCTICASLQQKLPFSLSFSHTSRVSLTLRAFEQFPCGRVKRFLKNNTQNKMRVGAKGMSKSSQCIRDLRSIPRG